MMVGTTSLGLLTGKPALLIAREVFCMVYKTSPRLANMQRNRRVPFAIWVTLWAIIVIAALALIITVVAWFAIP